MKIVLVLRHAKAKRSHSSGTDHARRLNTRGRDSSLRIGVYMHDQGYNPDITITSSSARTIETSQGIAEAFGGELKVLSEDALYLADPDRLLKTCQALDNALASVLLIGHNPGMHEFALSLVKNREDPLVRKLLGSFPTCALAAFRFDTDYWTGVAPAEGHLLDVVFPREVSENHT